MKPDDHKKISELMPSVRTLEEWLRDTIISRAMEAFGSREEGVVFLRAPREELGGLTPLEVLWHRGEAKKVSAILDALEHGFPA